MTSNGDLPNYPVNHSPVREIVTVFWDYENCPCPMSTKIATLTYDIKRRIDHFLGKKLNKRIQLYCPMQRLHERTRENATDLGILMMDVASKRKQESVDKRIIADIGLFATELAESSGNDLGHIVLVSGDSDYGYILARLRDKSYIGKIIIFINDYTKETLIQHADHTHCLFQSNLTRKDNPFSDLNQRKISPYEKIYSHNASYQYSTPYHSHNHHHNNNNNNNNNNNSHFQLNNNNNHNTQKRAWPYNLPYNAHANSNGNHMSDMNKYNGPHRVNKAANSNSNANAHANSTKAAHNNHHNHSRSQGHALYNGSFNGSFGASILKKQQKGHRNRNRSPTEHGRYTQNNVKILQKEEKEQSTAGTVKEYVYRRKGYKSPDIISAPPPIPPKPEGTACILTQVKLEPNGAAHSVSPQTAETSTKTPAKSLSNGAATKTKSHRIVSQENLEQQLKQRQKDAKKEKEAKLKMSPSNCANNKKPQNSTFSVAALYKINERNDEESKSKLSAKPRADTASPTKLDFLAIADDAFFEAMIPNQTDMDELFKHIAPKINVLHDDVGSPQTSPLPLKKILKMKKNHHSHGHGHGHKHKHSNTVITDQLRLVWDALCYCQADSNNTPRRREIYVAMNKTHSEYMKHRDMHFANECIDVCLAYGTVEEMIKGRISSLYILPVILNALTSNESTFYDAQQKLKMSDAENKSHVWITLDALKRHLVAGYTNHLSTYFTLTYLYRIIRNATRLFAFHKDDRQCHDSLNDELNTTQLAQIRFRVRKGAYNNNQSQAAQYNDSNKRAYNHSHNLTFNYYS